MHYIELIATATGFLYIIFTIRENMLLWLFGIISSSLFVWVFFRSSIYAYSLLYVYYVFMGFYGWYNWSRPSRGKGKKKGRMPVRRISGKGLVVCIVTPFIVAMPVYFALDRFTESDAPWLDSILTSAGMVATWMLTQKMIEQWLFWIAIDLLSFSLMIYKGLYPSSILFLAYTLLAVKGYIEWKKELTSPVLK